MRQKLTNSEKLRYIPVTVEGSSMAKESLAKAIFQVSSSMIALGIFSALILAIRRRFNMQD